MSTKPKKSSKAKKPYRRHYHKQKEPPNEPNGPQFRPKAWIERPIWEELRKNPLINFAAKPEEMIEGKMNLTYQHRVGSYSLDFAFPDIHLGIELDGKRYHTLHDAQRLSDYQRERDLVMLGWTVGRFMGTEVYHHASECGDWILQMAQRLYQDYDLPLNSTPMSKPLASTPKFIDGFCIICQAQIECDRNRQIRISKFCSKCVHILAEHEKQDPIGKYCHQCGVESPEITASSPFCKKCTRRKAPPPFK